MRVIIKACGKRMPAKRVKRFVKTKGRKSLEVKLFFVDSGVSCGREEKRGEEKK